MGSKENVLAFLEENKTNYISGEAIASKLGISRNAVWKAINELRKAGYSIDAVSNKGYMLSDDNDILSKAGIIAHLTDNLKSIYQCHSNMISIYDNATSTNRLAKEAAIAGAQHGTIILAKEQTAGRGRKDHSFYSPDGGLYMSILLKPAHLTTLEPDAITTLTGNAVCDAIETLVGVRPRIKPINDLFIDNKKICGILTEAGTEFETGDVQWIVVGIGINFDSDISAFPSDIKKTATSLFAPGKNTITKNQLTAAIINRIVCM
ncbi:MAG: biotin--[acetyl-CoA-carboxylase] ligase [Pseudobutyrivibrio sp.]|nr:biotin--[acetyl-CoA-carboxylase] ligase [Pseudobutyrivibrio sp.]